MWKWVRVCGMFMQIWCKHSQVMTPIAATVPDVLPLPRQINKATSAWCLLMWQMHCFQSPAIKMIKNTWCLQKGNAPASLFPQGYMNSSVLLHAIARRRVISGIMGECEFAQNPPLHLSTLLYWQQCERIIPEPCSLFEPLQFPGLGWWTAVDFSCQCDGTTLWSHDE